MDILDLSTDPKQECFAAYLNMAENNVFITLKDIVERLCLKQTCFKNGKETDQLFGSNKCYDATILQEDYLNTLTADKQEKLKHKLLRSFPFLVPMINTDRFLGIDDNGKYYYAKEKNEKAIGSDVTIRKEEELLKNSSIITIAKFLRTTFKMLSFYRDNASHTLPIDEDKAYEISSDSSKMAYFLDCVFKQACSVIKERFSLKGNELGGANLQFIQDKRVVKVPTGENNKPLCYPNFVYPHCFYRDDGKYTMSRMAVVYLICMFIEKSYATQFFSQISDDFYKEIEKNKNYQMYMREIYSCYRIRMPKNSTNPYEDNVMLAMDILNEITKCPNELFNCLNRKDQQKFEKETTENSDFPERVLLRRSADRFPELALKWIDGNKIFNKLRFNVIYGKYHDIFKDVSQETPGEKKCCDGIKRTRWISKELTTFGRIDDVENQRTGKSGEWDGKNLVKRLDDEEDESEVVSDTEDLSPWITDMRCQYVIKEDNIGIKITQGEPLPSINGKSLKDIRTFAPDFWLSLYELPAFVFLTILNNVAVEEKILGYQKKFRKLLTDLKDGSITPCASVDDLKLILEKKGYKFKNIPSKIIDCLLGKDQSKSFVKFAKAFLQDELERTQKRIADLEACKKGNEIIDPSRFLPGNVAKYLSADIVKYCKYGDGTEKPTGLNFNVMQSKLATFANKGQFADVKAVFEQLNMLQGCKAEHPFLQKVIDCEPKNVEQFFAKYLKEKKCFLEECKFAKVILQDELVNTQRIIADFESFHIGNEEIEPSCFQPDNIAKLLSADIVWHCKYSDGVLNFNVKQSKLATFANKAQFANIKAVFEKFNMLQGGESEHPFLQKVIDFAPENVEQFLDRYLKEKMAFLEKCKLKQAEHPDTCKSLQFLHPNRSKWQQRQLAKVVNEYLKLPIQLPKRLFDETIKNIILKDCPALKDKDKPTVSYMINAYMQSKDDDIQEFYKYGRTYPVFEKLDKVNNGEVKYRTKDELHLKNSSKFDNKLDSKDFFKKELAEYIKTCKSNPRKYRDFNEESATVKLRHLFACYDRTEKAITRYSVQDFLLMLIAEKLLLNQQIKKDKKRSNEKIEISIDSFKLKGIAPDSDKGLLSETVEIPIQLPKPNGYTVTWMTKIKDYSRIYKLYNDRRFLSLLGLLPKGNYPAEDIMREFENYDRNCIEAFKRILNFERKALKITSVKAANNQYVAENGRSNFYTILDALLNHLGFCGAERDKYLMINYFRDKYAHYQYPEEGLTLTSLKDASNKMFDKLNVLVDEINNKI